MIRRLLLSCGILSSLLYVVAIEIGAASWEGYSAASQTVSELIAIDAPSAQTVIPLFTVYSLLIFAFGLGVWMSAGNKKVLRVAAVLVIGKEVLGLAATFFAPMHLRGVAPTLSDTLHVLFTAAGVLLFMFPAIGFGAAAFGRWFRIYSVATMLVFLGFGTLAGMDGSRIAAGLPTPWLGIWERVNIFTYLFWIIVFAAALLRSRPGTAAVSQAQV
jgi:hypothetical protein